MSKHGLCCVECHATGTTQGENTGAAVEQERIIKVLEDVCKKYGLSEEGYTARLIAAIKGEQK